ncbi:MAG: AAA family ATPase, partial [Cyanobacteriota bacterium]|nr:AAA family ATPase [Cyanobacteriota bacterium]
MNRLEKISVKGFRRLQNVELKMRNLTVMIGANGSGKTSFLDVLSILAASANGNLQNTLQLKGGLNDILTKGKAQELELSVLMRVSEKQSLDYNLTLSPKGLSYEIREETLINKSDSNQSEVLKHIESYGLDIKYFSPEDRKVLRPNWEHNPLETSLSQVPKMYREAENFRKSLASCTYYGALDVSEKSPIRLPQTMRPAKLPGSKGEDLISCLYDLRESDCDRFETVENILSSAFPDFERLNFPPVAAGTLSMTWSDRNFSQPIYIHELSEGTLRFLWLVT